MIDTPPLATDLKLGAGRVSIQRVALILREGHSANLGVAPCALERGEDGGLSVVVPAVPGEALWLGLLLPVGTKVPTVTSDGRPLETVVVGTIGDEQRFLRSMAFGGADDVATTLVLEAPDSVARMTIDVLPLEAFNARFGFTWQPALSPSTYAGWRLP